ncbi:MAG: YggS family pyridoxal phosphate-dependent enzyme [Bacteroidota bacterium]
MSIVSNLTSVKSSLPASVTLVVVTKIQPVEKLMEVYNAGHIVFGENKVQEMLDKYEQLPKDIQWHLIGHLQSNKVKFIAPFVSLIQSVDSLKLLQEINKQALKNNRIIKCLLQVYIANEETKFGMDFSEVEQLLCSEELKQFKNISIVGLMGMATNTTDQGQIEKEFQSLNIFYKKLQASNSSFQILSMGMSSDYMLAVENGSTLVRIGSSIFGSRN